MKWEHTAIPTSTQIEDRLQVLCSSQRCFKALVQRFRDLRVQPLSGQCQRRRQSRGKVASSLSQQPYEPDISIISTTVVEHVRRTHPSAVNVFRVPGPLISVSNSLDMGWSTYPCRETTSPVPLPRIKSMPSSRSILFRTNASISSLDSGSISTLWDV